MGGAGGVGDGALSGWDKMCCERERGCIGVRDTGCVAYSREQSPCLHSARKVVRTPASIASRPRRKARDLSAWSVSTRRELSPSSPRVASASAASSVARALALRYSSREVRSRARSRVEKFCSCALNSRRYLFICAYEIASSSASPVSSSSAASSSSSIVSSCASPAAFSPASVSASSASASASTAASEPSLSPFI